MNERFRELAFQAMSINQKVSDDSFFVEVSKLNEFEKFAELIIKECAKVAYKYTDKPSNFELYSEIGWECLPGDLQDHIEKHFGVE